jgi:hypothetical protein
MASYTTLGFFNFNITAEKAKDFFLKNGFGPENLFITKVTAGEKFGEMPENDSGPGQNVAAKKPAHHIIINFFRHLFHFEGKKFDPKMPYTSDRDGYILTVLSTTSEHRQLTLENLGRHGAWFVKEM